MDSHLFLLRNPTDMPDSPSLDNKTGTFGKWTLIGHQQANLISFWIFSDYIKSNLLRHSSLDLLWTDHSRITMYIHFKIQRDCCSGSGQIGGL